MAEGVNVESLADGVVAVTLAWPRRRNALGPAEAGLLADAIEGLHEAQVVVLRAAGPAFCAGGDLRAILRLAADGDDAVRNAIYAEYQRLARAVVGFDGLSIAAIDGPAIGLGADLALMCDVRLAGSEAWFLQGWARLGLIPGTGGMAVPSSRWASSRVGVRRPAAALGGGPTRTPRAGDRGAGIRGRRSHEMGRAARRNAARGARGIPVAPRGTAGGIG